jgi:integrase
MGIEMKPGANHWYARFRVNGVIKQVPLETLIEGERPAKISEDGDRKFERSRAKALAEFKEVVRMYRGDPTAEKTIQRLVEIRTGQRAQFPKVAELPALWEAIPRQRAPNDRYTEQCKGVLKRFAEFVATTQPAADEFVKVTLQTARAFMDSETARGLSPKTWNDNLKLLRTTFTRLHPQLNDGSNPFHGLITKATETVNRDPFSIPEMKAIMDASTNDPFIRPIIITGMCTAMRRGDCCLLKWDDVDLDEGFITVKTSKTGETVDIPLFPILRDVLKEAKGGKSEFCFPKAAEMYRNNPDGITWRVKQVLTAAFRRRAIEEGTALPVLPEDELRKRAAAYMDGLPESKRTRHMRQIFDIYSADKDINEVMAETGLSRGSVSGLLNDIEKNIKCAFIRGKVRGTTSELLQDARGNGSRRASVRDFHSFRVTWITLALAAGVPLELVQRVTGHRTVAIVLKHYFRPGREDFRETIMAAMPELLTGPTDGRLLPSASATGQRRDEAGGYREPAGPGDALEEALKALEGMSPRNWKKQRDAVAGYIRQAKDWMDVRIVREVREEPQA